MDPFHLSRCPAHNAGSLLVGWLVDLLFMAQGSGRTYCDRQMKRRFGKKINKKTYMIKDLDGISHPDLGKTCKRAIKILKVST